MKVEKKFIKLQMSILLFFLLLGYGFSLADAEHSVGAKEAREILTRARTKLKGINKDTQGAQSMLLELTEKYAITRREIKFVHG